MRIGINGSGLIALGQPAAEIVAHAVQAEADGFASYWLAQLAAPDALTVLGEAGTRTATIELGTAVVPTWPRHPLMLAGQALTVSDLSGGRLTLGIGLAHQSTVESSLHVPFARPARHMDEYLSVLLPALSERSVDRARRDLVGHRRAPRRTGGGGDTVGGARGDGPPDARARRGPGRRHHPLAERTEGDRDRHRTAVAGRGRCRRPPDAPDRRQRPGCGDRRPRRRCGP